MQGCSFNLMLSKNFDLFTLCYSETAERKGIVNLATDPSIISNLSKLSTNVLQPIVDYFSLPLTVTSGYRCKELNKLVGGVENSQHCVGQAADILVGGMRSDELAFWIKENIDYDQLILEKFDPEAGSYGWVHCSFVSIETNRHHNETYDGHRYVEGIHRIPLVI